MRIALYVPPHLSWFHSLTRDYDAVLDICGDIHGLDKYSDRKKVVVDNLVGTDADVINRIQSYQNHADQIIVLNSEVPSNIVDTCRRLDLPKINLLITGKVNYQPEHMKIFRHENFFSCVQMLYQRLPDTILQNLKPYVTKPYYFDALLGLEKPVRTYVKSQIDQHCAGKVFATYYQNGEQLSSMDNKFFSWPEGVEIINSPTATSNNVMYYGQETWLSHVIPVDIYNQCAYSIISETYDLNEFSFYTEKTAKALLGKRLFVMFAGQHYLRNLRDLGFKTFDGIIDESYDSESDMDTRAAMAFQQVISLCHRDQQDVYPLAKPIIEHNYQLYMSRDWHADYLKLVQNRLIG